MDNETAPSTNKRTKSIRQRCIDDDDDIKTGIEYMKPTNSKDAYGCAMMKVARSRSSIPEN